MQKIKTKQISKSIFMHVIQPVVPIDNFEFVDLSKIKKIKKKSLSELYIGDLLDYMTDEERDIFLRDIESKIIRGGKIYIQAYDAKCLASALIYSNINTSIYKNLLFNNGYKKNIHTLYEIKNILSSYIPGKIQKCRFVNAIQYYIEYQKDE